MGAKSEIDERFRRKPNLNLLLIQSGNRNILIDTGLGNRLSAKQKRDLSTKRLLLPVSLAELGLQDKDITDVIMTHLHFDHAGGIVTDFGTYEALTFPKHTTGFKSGMGNG